MHIGNCITTSQEEVKALYQEMSMVLHVSFVTEKVEGVKRKVIVVDLHKKMKE